MTVQLGRLLKRPVLIPAPRARGPSTVAQLIPLSGRTARIPRALELLAIVARYITTLRYLKLLLEHMLVHRALNPARWNVVVEG